MNNNRCIFCNKIIPEGLQICSVCEKEQSQFIKEIKSVRNITPENEFCATCKKKKCNGECKDFKEYIVGLRKTKKGGRISKKSPARG